MKTYKNNVESQIQAVQYGVDQEAEQYVKQCTVGYDKKNYPVPGDLMGSPKNPFYAVQIGDDWIRIEKGDFITVNGSEIAVMPESVLKTLFTEI